MLILIVNNVMLYCNVIQCDEMWCDIIIYVNNAYEINHMWTADMKSNEEWSSLSGFIAQLVECRTGIARSRVQAPLKSWIFFRLLYAIVKIVITTARIILHLIIIYITYGQHLKCYYNNCYWFTGRYSIVLRGPLVVAQLKINYFVHVAS